MQKSVTFKGQEVNDLYDILIAANNLFALELERAKKKCAQNLTAENYAEFRKWEIRYEEAAKLRDKTFVPVYYEMEKKYKVKGGKS